jgi:transcriptional regulator with XRE-family HTH domain
MHWIYMRPTRLKLNLTQTALAKKAGVLQHTISKLETTTHARPPYATHMKIARALDIDPDRLRFGPDPRVRGRDLDLRRDRFGRPTRRADDPPAPTPETDDDAEDTPPANPSSGGTV